MSDRPPPPPRDLGTAGFRAVCAATRRDTVLAYVALTKTRVIELLLVATIPVMLQADREVDLP